MGLLEKLFGNKNSNANYNNQPSNVDVHIEEDLSNKEKCENCGSLVDKNVKYCWKCGNPINVEIEEKLNEDVTKEKEKIEEKIEYKYPDLELIKDEKLKKAIKDIPNSGILNIPIGLDKEGKYVYYDLTKMPNLLIGGTVMSGKTNMINSILLSLISKYSTEEMRLILADSKGVDYACYNGEPHLLTPVIKNVKQLEDVLKNEINEMQNRYSLLSTAELKKISDYNKLDDVSKIPYHLIFIDDYTVFANGYENECNACIEMLAKSGWNVGIHLIIVANHPTVNVLTAISQLNFPTRISFRVPSIKDSRMVLESPGAEKISGIGNALINSPMVSKLEQIHVNIVEDSDIVAIIKDLSSKNKSNYINIVSEPKPTNVSTKHGDYEEPLYNEIVEFVVSCGKASASLIQRRFRMGYNRAAHAMDLLEANGIIGPSSGSAFREVLVKKDY